MAAKAVASEGFFEHGGSELDFTQQRRQAYSTLFNTNWVFCSRNFIGAVIFLTLFIHFASWSGVIHVS